MKTRNTPAVTELRETPNGGSQQRMVRRHGYNFCETHQQEYLQYCCGCALAPWRRKSSRQRAEEAITKSKERTAKW